MVQLSLAPGPFFVMQRERAGQGRHCTYIPIRKRVGVKAYDLKKLAIYACKMQRKASQAGVGPRVVGNVFKVTCGKLDYFCYLSEHVPFVPRSLTRNIPIRYIQTTLESLGFVAHDLNKDTYFNFGKTYRGKWVAVDFGPFQDDSCLS